MDIFLALTFIVYAHRAKQVPLTQSLYVPGKVIEANKMMVDIGTGYYVEKDQPKTKEFLERKVQSSTRCSSYPLVSSYAAEYTVLCVVVRVALEFTVFARRAFCFRSFRFLQY